MLLVGSGKTYIAAPDEGIHMPVSACNYGPVLLGYARQCSSSACCQSRPSNVMYPRVVLSVRTATLWLGVNSASQLAKHPVLGAGAQQVRERSTVALRTTPVRSPLAQQTLAPTPASSRTTPDTL